MKMSLFKYFKSEYLLLPVMFHLVGCSYGLEELGLYKTKVLVLKTQAVKLDSIDYAAVKANVLDTSCNSCHSAAGGNKGNVNLETYASVINNISDVKADIEDGSMPRGDYRLTADQKNMILAWIKMGAPLLAGQGSSGTDTVSKNQDDVQEQIKPIKEYDSAIMKELAVRGKYLFELSSCLTCHTQDASKPLGGGRPMVSGFGTFYSPNISPDVKTGIGAWSASDFLKAMREGISPSNHYYYPVFPFANYSKLSDEDILSIQAFIMTLKPIDNPNKKHEVGFPFDQRFLLALWRPSNFPTVKDQNIDNYRLAKGPFQTILEKDLEWNRGAYLVESALHCTMCHTPRNQFGGLKVKEWMAGSDISGGDVPAPNITPDRQTGLNGWTEDHWEHFLLTGQKPDGDFTGGEMKKLVRNATAKLTESDRMAVVKYLMSLDPVSSKVTKPSKDK
jgi:mono/diheme cytochrome c family protein